MHAVLRCASLRFAALRCVLLRFAELRCADGLLIARACGFFPGPVPPPLLLQLSVPEAHSHPLHPPIHLPLLPPAGTASPRARTAALLLLIWLP